MLLIIVTRLQRWSPELFLSWQCSKWKSSFRKQNHFIFQILAQSFIRCVKFQNEDDNVWWYLWLKFKSTWNKLYVIWILRPTDKHYKNFIVQNTIKLFSVRVRYFYIIDIELFMLLFITPSYIIIHCDHFSSSLSIFGGLFFNCLICGYYYFL